MSTELIYNTNNLFNRLKLQFTKVNNALTISRLTTIAAMTASIFIGGLPLVAIMANSIFGFFAGVAIKKIFDRIKSVSVSKNHSNQIAKASEQDLPALIEAGSSVLEEAKNKSTDASKIDIEAVNKCGEFESEQKSSGEVRAEGRNASKKVHQRLAEKLLENKMEAKKLIENNEKLARAQLHSKLKTEITSSFNRRTELTKFFKQEGFETLSKKLEKLDQKTRENAMPTKEDKIDIYRKKALLKELKNEKLQDEVEVATLAHKFEVNEYPEQLRVLDNKVRANAMPTKEDKLNILDTKQQKLIQEQAISKQRDIAAQNLISKIQSDHFIDSWRVKLEKDNSLSQAPIGVRTHSI